MVTGRSKPYAESLQKDLQDDEFVIEYLNLTLDEDGPEMFLAALAQVAKVRNISMEEVSQMAGVPRRTAYHALSEEGNPGLKLLVQLTFALGFKLQIASVHSDNPPSTTTLGAHAI